jgi:hypothetical protein
LAGDGKGLACPLSGDVVEASTVAVEHRLLASKLLPARGGKTPQSLAAPCSLHCATVFREIALAVCELGEKPL